MNAILATSTMSAKILLSLGGAARQRKVSWRQHNDRKHPNYIRASSYLVVVQEIFFPDSVLI